VNPAPAGPVILVVEDNADTRDIVGTLLMHHGYSVVEVETAEAMLEQVDVVQPSLIILDIRLPGIDGCKGLQKLRAAGHTMPVFIFSEFYDLVRDEIEACQPDAFFPKSKGPNEMIRAIATKLAAQPSK
jgi:two-component system, NtrC family, response regulator GlrR